MGLLGDLLHVGGSQPSYRAPDIDPGYTARTNESMSTAMKDDSADYQKKRMDAAQKAQGLLGDASATAISNRAYKNYNNSLGKIARQSMFGAVEQKQEQIGKAFGYVNHINALIAKQRAFRLDEELKAIAIRNEVLGEILEGGGYAMGIAAANYSNKKNPKELTNNWSGNTLADNYNPNNMVG